MNKRICIYPLLISLLFIAYAEAQCSHCSTSELQDITDCITKLEASTTVLAVTQDNANTLLCDTTRDVIKCYKECYCKCLADSDNINAKNEIESFDNTLTLYKCPDFAEQCIVWKEGSIYVNNSPLSAHASKFVMLISCLFLFMLMQ